MLEKQNCTGCGACVLRCPTYALSMKCNEEGFYYPHINIAKCVNCGLCSKVCHLNLHIENTIPLKVYAAVNKNTSTLLKSASGGVFGAIADFVLMNNGVCYGVTLENLNAKYLRVQNKEELYKLYGSKYVQVNNSNVYDLVEKDCKNGKEVLFVGTPCLVAGLKQFLRQDYRNLYTVDIVCHGIPSKLYFEKYIEYISCKLGGRISEFNFRDKSKYGIGCISSCIINKGKRTKRIIHTNQLLNYYYYMFADSYRESCYQCKYTNLRRVSDITLGDFWGIEKLNSSLDVRYGCSAVIINSLRGDCLLYSAISKQCNLEERSIQDVLVRNTALYKNIIRPAARNSLYSELIEKGLNYMISTRYKPSMFQYAKGYAKGILPVSVQKIIHRYL